MKETNVTSIQPSGWIPSKVGQCMQWVLASLLLFFGSVSAFAQNAGPNCTDINAAIGADGYINVAVEEFVTNCADAIPTLEYVVYNQFNGVVTTGTVAACTDVIRFYACNAIGRTYKVNFTNDLGSCWSELTFKQSNGPLVMDTTWHMYCLEEEVSDIGLYLDRFYGDNDGEYEPYPGPDYKPATVPCEGTVPTSFVADWVTPFPCVVGLDTAKIVLREFEAFDKFGNRGSAFDTIYVYRLPQLTPTNIYCAERDTTYCGVSATPGPYMVAPAIDSSTGMQLGTECDTLYFLDYTESTEKCAIAAPATFDPKCGISVSVGCWEFADVCSPQYKITIDIKQTCWSDGIVSTCVVADMAGGPGTPNAFVEVGGPGSGYWRCEYWLIDYDTVPPMAKCKYDKSQEQNLLDPGCFPNYPFDPEFQEHYDECGLGYVIQVPTGTHDCYAHTYLPPLCVYDDWSGIKQVKARIEGVGAWVLTESDEDCETLKDKFECTGDKEYDVTGKCYEAHERVRLPKSADGTPIQVLYEIYDNCHNIDSVYCYLLIKDRTKPVAVADKGVTVSLSDKKVWVDAETFDEGSWDNCGVNLLLARRADWYEACIDLCDSVTVVCSGPHGDSIYAAFLEPDKHKKEHAYDDDVEAHYAKNLDWWCNDGVPCGELIYNAWQYDLMKYATLECVDHPYEVDAQYFRHIFEQCYIDYYDAYGCFSEGTRTSSSDGTHGGFFGGLVTENHSQYYYLTEDSTELIFDRWKCLPSTDGCTHLGAGAPDKTYEQLKAEVDIYEQIGGGWSDAVPFDCSDACGPVTVEILVMDYWCNWSKAWTKVWVEDKTPVTVGKDVYDEVEISCYSYKQKRYGYSDQEHPVSLEYLVAKGKTGDQEALDSIDAILGGYVKAWVDPYGNYADENWDPIDCDIVYSDSVCDCTTYTKQIRVYDEHLGYLWKDSVVTECFYEEVDIPLQHGVVAVNCAENVQCDQTIWCDFDHCGQGYIYRKFKIWQGCPENEEHSSGHIPDTIYRHQRIWVGNQCELNKYMFDVPYDQEVFACGIEYDPDGSGNVVGAAGPDSTGYATYKFDDDCRIIGIAHEDKVFKIVGGDAGCYKILRTWYFADWCQYDKPVDGAWWKDGGNGFDPIYCVQKIIVRDTMPPVCTITGPVEDGGTVSAAGCYFNLEATVDVSDPCGLIEYYWELKDIAKDPAELVEGAYGSGELTDESAQFTINVDDLGSGDYKLKVRVTDECQNESYCEYNFTVEAGKKPSPVCITSLTVELTPWDIDQDGTIDTAKAAVWADEFDRSSSAPCGREDEELNFYIEFLEDTDTGNDTLNLEGDSTSYADLDSLALGCEHVGTHTVRMWVESGGTSDYCDVVLIVQNNMGGCGDISGNAVVGLIQTELEETVANVEVTAELENGQKLNGITSLGGAYAIANSVLANQKVVVKPSKNTDHDNGVSTIDLVRIQKHILGKSILDSEFKQIAADANNDGRISALDLLEIRKLILGKTDQFANRESWSFLNKIDKQESYTIEPLVDREVVDFTAIKIGDVNGNALTNTSAGRSGKSLVFNVDDVQMVAGNQYKVDFKANNFNDITGYQFTINLDKNALNIVNVESGVLEVTGDNFGMNQMKDGLITTSWNAAEGMSIDENEVVFSIVVEATSAAHLSDALALNSRITDAEAYNSAEQIHDVSVNFTGGVSQAGFALLQNEPNPFMESTVVGFSLPEAMSATVTVYDVTGKVVKVVDGDYAKGYNEVTFKRADLATTGVLYYQLDTEAFTATKKMIVIE